RNYNFILNKQTLHQSIIVGYRTLPSSLFLLGSGGVQLDLLVGSSHALVAESRELLPRRLQIEFSELLSELARLVHDTLQLGIVSNLIVSREGEVLSEWVSLESVVSQNATEIGMVVEPHTVHVANLSLEPVGSLEHGSNRVDRSDLDSVGADANAGIESDGVEGVHHLKSVLTSGYVDTTDEGEVGELGGVVTLKEGENGDDSSGMDEQLELISSSELDLLDELGQALSGVSAEVGEFVAPLLVDLPDRGLLVLGGLSRSSGGEGSRRGATGERYQPPEHTCKK
ncbi:hypothetical protein PFISCL1PPCAC_20476, partial [Pristionchus fissidentatus]